MFTTVFGNTTYAVSAVLTGFMAGLALGSYVIGRLADRSRRPLLLYAILEVGIALSACLMPSAVDLAEGLYSSLYLVAPGSEWLLTCVKGIISFLVMLAPTFLMGATLPVLSRFVVEHRLQVGRKVGMLYAVNTFGAALGCLLTGFFLIEHLGVRGTVYAAAAVNFGLALAFYALDRILPPRNLADAANGRSGHDGEPEEEADGWLLIPGRLRILLVGFGLAGFCSLAYEVLWFRVLVFQLKTTTYSFSVMLAAFLTGIALGSALFSLIERRPLASTRLWLLFGVIEGLIGIMGLASILLLTGLEDLAAHISVGSWAQKMAKNYLMALVIMLPPATLMGMAFPVVCRIVSQQSARISTAIGGVYCANTLGCIFGPLVTGFFLVRAFGTQWTIVIVALLNLSVATVIFLRAPCKRGFGVVVAGGLWAAAILAVVLIPGDLLFQYYNVSEKSFDSRVEILYAHEAFPGHPGATYLLSEIGHYRDYDTDLLEDAALRELFVVTDDFIKAGILDKPAETMEIARERYPEDYRVHYKRGVILSRLGRPDESVEAYRRSLDLEPGFAGGWNNLGLALASSGSIDEELAAYRKAIE